MTDLHNDLDEAVEERYETYLTLVDSDTATDEAILKALEAYEDAKDLYETAETNEAVRELFD